MQSSLRRSGCFLLVLFILPLNAKEIHDTASNLIKEFLDKHNGNTHTIVSSESHWINSDGKTWHHNAGSSSGSKTDKCNCDAMISRIDSIKQTYDPEFKMLTAQVATLDSRVNDRLDQLASRLNATEGHHESFHATMQAQLSKAEQDSRFALHGFEVELSSTKQNLESKIDRMLNLLKMNLTRLDSRIDQLEARVAEQAKQGSKLPASHISRDKVLELLKIVHLRLDDLSSRVQNMAVGNGSAERRPQSPPLQKPFAITGPAEKKPQSPPREYRDCSDLPAKARGGVYNLTLGVPGAGGRPTVLAYCDMWSDGGGWTVIQRRIPIRPPVKFNRGWAGYKKGFGKLQSEFWWGLENIFRMTAPQDRQYELLVNLVDFRGRKRHALYGQFKVASEADGYRLFVSKYTGDAGDSLKFHNNCKFSTNDKDQDFAPRRHCGREFRAGWWYRGCRRANLNGAHVYKGKHKRGIVWNTLKGSLPLINRVEMKIRPVKATKQ